MARATYTRICECGDMFTTMRKLEDECVTCRRLSRIDKEEMQRQLHGQDADSVFDPEETPRSIRTSGPPRTYNEWDDFIAANEDAISSMV